jgi:hypothetical protein
MNLQIDPPPLIAGFPFQALFDGGKGRHNGGRHELSPKAGFTLECRVATRQLIDSRVSNAMLILSSYLLKKKYFSSYNLLINLMQYCESEAALFW